MRIKGISLLLIVACLYTCRAQTDSLRHPVRYYNTFLSGTLIGCGQCANGKDFTFSFTTFHGIAFKSVKVGVGTGIDTYYDWRMIPLLAGFTLDKASRKNSVYFHINGGYSFGHFLAVDNRNEGVYSDSGGFTINPMLGYRMGNDKVRLYIQAGYKYQYAKASVSYSGWGWPYGFSRQFDLNRVVIQLGFGIN